MELAVYDNAVLRFSICPTYRYKSWLDFEHQFNQQQPLQNLEHALELGLHDIPYERLKKIEINIEAPNWKDPGQLICLYKKCVDLASLLENAKNGLPDIEFNLLDVSLAKWNDGLSMDSIHRHLNHHYIDDHSLEAYSPDDRPLENYSLDDQSLDEYSLDDHYSKPKFKK